MKTQTPLVITITWVVALLLQWSGTRAAYAGRFDEAQCLILSGIFSMLTVIALQRNAKP